MKLNRYWRNSLAMLTVASLTWATPIIANEITPRTTSAFSGGNGSIEIYVPSPENEDENNTIYDNGVTGNTCPTALDSVINRIIGNQPGRWGILVESLTDRNLIYSHNADKYFIPASNVKIFTTAATLQRLNPETSIRSKSVRDWITVTNLRSNNNYAETLFRYIGGAPAAKAALSQLGIDPKSYRLADGSGLSRRNVATPRALVETLRAMYFAPGNDLFHASLPIAGMSGTLRNRMRQTPAQGRVHAKTGTLQGVRALSGYLDHPQYGTLVFSIIANNPSQSGTALVRAIDSIVLQLSRLTPCQ
jgi:D-alanyl-D-alanine carboxypeptidase/D-alanyl-D-alanine-endopeptidase (penicillin-binding protein 4)